MKRVELLAWSGVAGLIGIAGILLCGGIIYHFTGYWAGMLLVLGQSLVLGLAGWGLMLSRQAAELSGPALGGGLEGGMSLGGEGTGGAMGAGGGGFRMSMGGDERVRAEKDEGGEAKTIDVGYQRLWVGVSALLLLGLAAAVIYMIATTLSWGRAHPDQGYPIAGMLPAKDLAFAPVTMDELAVVIGLGAAGLYGILWWVSRPRRHEGAEADAVHGIFTMGLGGMAALGVVSVLGYLKVAYASEVGAGIIAGLMILEGMELGFNAMRSYSGVEELDQEAVDLLAQPLAPMLGSAWLSGLRLLFAQSVGFVKEGERGVVARMMPRVLGAVVVIAIGMSCLRVVKPGQVAILERLGYVQHEANGDISADWILKPGLHVTYPWPIDTLFVIPTETLQFTDVGAEVHSTTSSNAEADFQFWTVRAGGAQDEQASEFITGDPGSPELLETYVGVWWRVKDPAKFYNTLSHSDFFEKSSEATTTKPIFEEIVQQCTSFAVTRTFAIHTLDQIMVSDRGKVEMDCKHMLQATLDSLSTTGGAGGKASGCGIEIVDLTIKDLHPPFWKPDQQDPTRWKPAEDPNQAMRRGPASAFEYVVSLRELEQTLINVAETDAIVKLNQATGDAAKAKNEAETYKANKVSDAQGEANRLVAGSKGLDGLSPEEARFELSLLESNAKYQAMDGKLAPVNKVISDPSITVDLLQTTESGSVPVRPAPPPGR